MVKLRRPHVPSREPATDARGGAHQDLPGEAAVAEGGAATRDASVTVSRDEGKAAAVDGDGAADVTALLPDVQASEQDRRRERRLVEAACRGENSAIEALYRTHFDTIYRYVLYRVGSSSAAEDVTSQVFLGMVRGLGRYRDEGKPFVAWLYGIAQKQTAFFQRGRSRAPTPMDLDDAAELVAQSAGPHATAEQRELRVEIAQALGKVPDGQREVIMLRYILSLSLAETAAIVGRSEGAVKQLQLRGLATLKTILGREGVDLR
ncbi:MAG: sigma-70 family RNA polymerase sigma factor [bacterium]